MKRSEIYLKAAKIVDPDSRLTGACLAIAKVAYKSHMSYRHVTARNFPELLSFKEQDYILWLSDYDDCEGTAETRRELRQTVLLFCHEIAKSNGN